MNVCCPTQSTDEVPRTRRTTATPCLDWRRQWGHVPPYRLCLSLIAGLVLLSCSTAQACNTPVYRYAMYNWAPAPYYVFYFHHGEPAKEDEEVNRMITELGDAVPAAANVALEPVDLSQGQLDRLPEPVKQAWQPHAESGEPMHIVFTSWGAELAADRLDAAAVGAMVDSPARTRLGELLGEGCAAVMLFVPGTDAAENQQAEKVARELIARARAGSIPGVYQLEAPDLSQWVPAAESPEGAAEDNDTTDDTTDASTGLELGLVKVARSDAAEHWLVRSLMAIEPDLDELSEQPMIFFAYGRGRVMPPYVGKGITPDNLAEEVAFLAGACSCMVKEQNPGVDLLLHRDWEATAEAMAAHDPSFYGGQFAYQEFTADEAGNVDPSAPPEAVASVTPETAAEVAPADADPQPEPADATPSQAEAGQRQQTPPTAAEGDAAKKQPDKKQPAKERPNKDASRTIVEKPQQDPGGSFLSTQMWTFGIGLAVALAVVLTAGFVLVRK